MLRIDDLTVTIPGCHILNGVSFHVERGETLVVMGKNGSGKSTLISSHLGITHGPLKVSFQKYTINKKESSTYSQEELFRMMSFVPQFPDMQDGLTVKKYFEYCRYPQVLNGKSENFELLKKILSSLEIESLLDRTLDMLSGGELKRVAFTGALYQETPIVLLDEPFQALDPKGKHDIGHLIKRWQKEYGTTFVIVCHDFFWGTKLGDKVLFLKRGETVSFGEKTEIYNKENLERTFDIPFQKVSLSGEDVLLPIIHEEVI